MSALISVCVFPSGPVVTIPGRNKIFICQLVTTEQQNVSWLLNGSALENYGLDNVISEQIVNNQGILTFTNLSLENNHTTIQCQATLPSGMNRSTSAVLLLQGMKVMKRPSFKIGYCISYSGTGFESRVFVSSYHHWLV